MDKGDSRFRELRGACDIVSRSLREKGVGAEVKHAAVFSADEDRLWDSGAIGTYSPQALLRAVFFYLGKTLCIRGGQEQRNLKPSQFRREYDPDRYIYVENGSKNHPGTFGHNEQSNKVVPMYSNRSAVPRCAVHLLDLYFSKCPQPPNALSFFYLKPLPKKPVEREAPWFQSTPIGKNTLAKFVETMCKDAGIKGKKTNHSLRATGATSMFAAGVPEKLIKNVTGHKSTKALEVYERPTVQQQQAVSRVLSTPSSSYTTEMEKTSIGEQSMSVNVMRKQSVTRQQSIQSQTSAAPDVIGAMFNGLTNCSVNITPQNFVVNIQQPSQVPKPDFLFEEFDDLVKDVEF